MYIILYVVRKNKFIDSLPNNHNNLSIKAKISKDEETSYNFMKKKLSTDARKTSYINNFYHFPNKQRNSPSLMAKSEFIEDSFSNRVTIDHGEDGNLSPGLKNYKKTENVFPSMMIGQDFV